MNQLKVIILFIKDLKKKLYEENAITKIEIDTIHDQVLSLVKYSNILQVREVKINICNVCEVGEHIVNIRHLSLNYKTIFIDLHELFNKLFLKNNVFKTSKKLISNFKKNNEPMQNLKTIFSFVNKLGFFLNNSNISKEEIENSVNIINLIKNTLDGVILQLEAIDFKDLDQVKRSLRVCALQFEHCQELSLKLIRFTEKILDQLDLDSCD